MCSCEPGWVCASCRDSRLDDSYPENERPERDEEPLVRDLERSEA